MKLVLDECSVLVFRSRRSEARIQQMSWKVNYSDIVFIHSVRVVFISWRLNLCMLRCFGDDFMSSLLTCEYLYRELKRKTPYSCSHL